MVFPQARALKECGWLITDFATALAQTALSSGVIRTGMNL
jgi:hypothetical protein